MKINQQLNLVTSVENDAGDKVFIHSQPLSRDLFREHFAILAKTYAAIFGEGMGIISGPRIAYLMLESVAKAEKIWDGREGIRNTLVTHIVNGCTAIVLVEGEGWKSMPLEAAVNQNLVELDDVLGEIVFFTCVCGINKPSQIQPLMKSVNGIWGSSSTPLSATEFVNSLKTSQQEGITEPNPQPDPQNGATASSIPS